MAATSRLISRLTSLRTLIASLSVAIAVLVFVFSQSLQTDLRAPHVRQVETFTSVADMTNAADAVIQGTIISVAPGRTLPKEAGPVRFYEVVVRVDSVEAGTLSSPEVTLEVDNVVFPDIELANRAWPVQDTSTLLFLHRKTDDATKFRPVSSQGAFTLRGTDVIAADTLDPLAASVAGLSNGVVLQQVAATH